MIVQAGEKMRQGRRKFRRDSEKTEEIDMIGGSEKPIVKEADEKGKKPHGYDRQGIFMFHLFPFHGAILLKSIERDNSLLVLPQGSICRHGERGKFSLNDSEKLLFSLQFFKEVFLRWQTNRTR